MRMTAAELARIASVVSSVLDSSPEFHQVVAEVRQSSISAFGYNRPTTSSFQGVSERQAAPLVPGAEGLLVAERVFALTHIAAAKLLPHPLARLLVDAQPDLVDAVGWVHSFGKDAAAVCRARDRRMSDMARWARMLTGVEDRLSSLQSPTAKAVRQPGCCISLVAAWIKGLGLPDELFTAHQCSGFPCYGDYPDSGLFRECERPAEEVFEELDHEAQRLRVVEILTRQSNDPNQRHTLERVTEKTYKEADVQMVAEGPFLSRQEVDDRLHTTQWRVLHRFGVCQGYEEDGSVKVRPCDNAGESSKTNLCLSYHETIATEQPTFPVLVAALFAALGGGPVPLHHSTDDVELAYRRAASAHPEATVVAIWDTRLEAVTYWVMDGHNFGLVSAVLTFNRYSHIASRVCRRLGGLPCAAYFDDFDVTDSAAAGRSGKIFLHAVCRYMGIPLSLGSKDVDPAPCNPFLGVISDLENAHLGTAVMRSKPSRIAHMLIEIGDMLHSSAALVEAMDEVVGKLEYTSQSGAAGRFGRAALSALREWAMQRRRLGGRGRDAAGRHPLGDTVRLALGFFLTVLPLIRPRVFKLGALAHKHPPILVYTDARYSPKAEHPAQIGIAIYDPEDVADGAGYSDESAPRSPRWRHSDLIIPPDVMALFAAREQYVGQLEVLAGVAAYTSRPEQLRGRDILHFIDNTGALFGLAKGYSGDDDSCRLIHQFHCVLGAIDANVWLEYVASGANISDLPSRGEFALLLELGSTRFETVMPAVGGDWAAVYRQTFKDLAPRPSASMKRARKEVDEEVRRVRSRSE